MREGAGADEGSTAAGQLALGEIGVALEDVAGHEEAERRVAQELQPLVGTRQEVGLLVEVGAVGEGLDQPGRLMEVNAKAAFGVPHQAGRCLW